MGHVVIIGMAKDPHHVQEAQLKAVCSKEALPHGVSLGDAKVCSSTKALNATCVRSTVQYFVWMIAMSHGSEIFKMAF